MIRRPLFLAILSVCALTFAARAQEKPTGEAHAAAEKKTEEKKPEDKKPEEKSKDEKPKDEKPKETSGAVTIAGTEVKYRAKTGTLPLLKDDGSGEKARVFFVYYAVIDADGKLRAGVDARQRPITFCFNGGPGSSAVW